MPYQPVQLYQGDMTYPISHQPPPPSPDQVTHVQLHNLTLPSRRKFYSCTVITNHHYHHCSLSRERHTQKTSLSYTWSAIQSLNCHVPGKLTAMFQHTILFISSSFVCVCVRVYASVCMPCSFSMAKVLMSKVPVSNCSLRDQSEFWSLETADRDCFCGY